MPSIQQLFKWGLDRDIPELIEPPAYREVVGKRYLTMPEAMRAEPMGVGQELPWLNLGPGDKKVIEHRYPSAHAGWSPAVKDTVGVGPEHNGLTKVKWVFPEDLPYDDETVGAVHMHQFLEHFTGDDAIEILHEVERVLVPGGVAFITVPYQGTSHWGQALDHKSTWNEETWDWLFNNEYYQHDTDPWRFQVHACFIMGIVIRNLDLFTQLVKR
jgi:SAM-dependent methyltransferase